MNELEHPGVDTACPIGPPQANGVLPVLRHKGNGVYVLGELHPLQHGKPIYGELVTVHGDGEWRQLKPMLGGLTNGPTMVNSREYREGWTTIFGHQTYGQA